MQSYVNVLARTCKHDVLVAGLARTTAHGATTHVVDAIATSAFRTHRACCTIGQFAYAIAVTSIRHRTRRRGSRILTARRNVRASSQTSRIVAGLALRGARTVAAQAIGAHAAQATSSTTRTRLTILEFAEAATVAGLVRPSACPDVVLR